jgi:hypothetical protein
LEDINMPTIKEVVEGRIAYAKERAQARLARASELGEHAARYSAQGDHRAARDASMDALALQREADMWKECSEALLQPILMALDAK